jgi:hypothetical protein
LPYFRFVCVVCLWSGGAMAGGVTVVVWRWCRVVDNFRSPAVMEGWGYGWEQLRSWNPTVIYGQNSSYGPRGPKAGEGSFDGVCQVRRMQAVSFRVLSFLLVSSTCHPRVILNPSVPTITHNQTSFFKFANSELCPTLAHIRSPLQSR